MKLFKTTIFSGIITLFRFSTIFISNKVVAIYTGTAGIALIGAFTNFVTIILNFANGAINTGIVKYTAQYDGDNEKLKILFSTSFKLCLYCSFSIGILLFFGGPFFASFFFSYTIFANPLRLLGVTSILFSLNSLLIAILNGKKKIKSFTIINVIGSIVSLIFTLILVFFFKIVGALYSLVLSQSIVFFVTFFLIRKMEWFSLDDFKQKMDIGMAKKLGQYSLMTIVTSLTIPVSHIILRNMLINSFGLKTAGIWQGMMRISDSYLMILTTALSTYYLPKLSSLHSNIELKREILSGFKFILPIVFFSCISIFAFKDLIIRILFTSEFMQMSDLFFYHLAGDFFKVASWILAYLMVAKAMTKIYILTEVLTSLVYVFSGFICTKVFGMKGISIAFFITYLIYFLTMLILFRKTLFNKID